MAGDRRSDRNNGGEGPSNNGTGLSREDLMAIATIVATTLQGLVGPNHNQAPRFKVGPNHNQAPPPPPPPRGTKFYYESLHKIRTPTFDGRHDPEVAQTWMKNIETQLRLLEVPDAVKSKNQQVVENQLLVENQQVVENQLLVKNQQVENQQVVEKSAGGRKPAAGRKSAGGRKISFWVGQLSFWLVKPAPAQSPSSYTVTQLLHSQQSGAQSAVSSTVSSTVSSQQKKDFGSGIPAVFCTRTDQISPF
ncbi:hypothetical protein F511_36814 [Dorcoceras hygrometricum]|uniref:Uncharacterized protein n=1 Tax=Dorcoceras hygrometricum TaxID=472368 RepID=A0A2Z7BQH9_9LAMI|nr:hypothetical protein F511_36814 [Dorcoceras hygrometricum]